MSHYYFQSFPCVAESGTQLDIWLYVKSFPGLQQFCEAASGDLLERMRDPAAGLQNPSANHHQHHHHRQHHNYCYIIIRSQLNGTLREHGSVDPPLNSWHLVTLNCHATAKTRFLLVGTTLLTSAPILGKLDQNLPQRITAVKSNALAELMNRASKIHWKNLSWL